jgi:dienelactone hydrolase
MKKALLVGVLAIVAQAVLSATDDSANLAAQFVDLLAKGDFAAATARYDETMRQVLPEAKLKKTWETLQEQAGQFKERLQTRALKMAGFDVVLVTCQFESIKVDVKVALNAKGEVSGLFFLPSGAAPETTGPPAYANTNAFHERDFTVGGGEWRLPGTLTLPAETSGKPSPALVLVHGSGPNDRDQTLGAVKPFRDLAWGLATKGIAVLRYEKRTKEYAGRFMGPDKPKITVQEETIDDALSAVKQLRETEDIDAKRIFVLGISQGGTVAPRIGLADPQIAGLIILAGATRPLEDLIVDQTRYLLSLKGEPSPAEQDQLRELESAAARVKTLTPADAVSSSNLLGAPVGYWLDLRAHDPVREAKSLKQPILILQGGRDYQVTQTDFNQWKQGLGASPRVAFELYPQLNHLFVSGEGKSAPQEYEKPGHVSGTVIADIADWILTRR